MSPPPAPGAVPRIRFVLVQPSHPGNIGAAARALRAMGLGGLHVVDPREPSFRTHPEAVALATHGADLLAAASVQPSLVAALAGTSLSFAMTGYPREYGPPLVDVEVAAAQAAAHLGTDPGDVAFVFGTERTGLANADVQRCTFSCAIDADAEHGSLNLAQAVQVTAYACRRAGLAARGDPSARRSFTDDPAATAAEMEGLHAHLERALVAIGFLDPQAPRRLTERLRRLFGRAAPSRVDVAILRGICAAMIESKAERAGRGRGAGPGAGGPAQADH